MMKKPDSGQLASSEKELDLAKEDFMARDSHQNKCRNSWRNCRLASRNGLISAKGREFRLNLKSYGFTDERTIC